MIGTDTREEFGAEPWDAPTGLVGAPVDAVELVDVCATAAFDAEDAAEGDATGPVPGTAEVVADPGDTEREPEPGGAATGPAGTAVGPAEAADLCPAARASTCRTGTSAAAPDAPGANWTDAAAEPEEAAVGRTGGVADAVEVTVGPAGSAAESTEVETPAEDSGAAPRDTGAATGASGAAAPVPPREPPVGAPAAFLVATGRLRRCTTGAPETLVSGTAPATDEDTATEEALEPAVPAPAPPPAPEPEAAPAPAPAEDLSPATGSAPAEAGAAPATGRRCTTGTAPTTGRRPTTGTGAGTGTAPAPAPPAEPAPTEAPEADAPPPELPTTGTTRGPAARATAPGKLTR